MIRTMLIRVDGIRTFNDGNKCYMNNNDYKDSNNNNINDDKMMKN